MAGLQGHAIKNRKRQPFNKLSQEAGIGKMIKTYKQPRQDLNLCGYSLARYSEKCTCFTQICRALYGDAMLVPFGGALRWRP